jgi:deoxycytidine triphosphate deaminase
MPLSAVKILELNKEYNLIEGLSEREIKNPEGCGFDLRVGRVEKINGESFLGVKERSSPETEVIGDIEKEGNKIITIKPGKYLLVQTIEKITSPDKKVKYEEGSPARYLMPFVFPRSSLQRGAISFHATKTDPGYSGKLTFGIKNQGEHDFKFELGARMFNLVFEPIIGELKRTYSGQHQGGRVSSQGEVEVQN